MNISKFKLINKGYSGISIEAAEHVTQGNITHVDSVGRDRRYPIPDSLRTKIQGLKYFYLNLTGHWIEPYNKYFDRDNYKIIEDVAFGANGEVPKSYSLLQALLSRTEIIGVSTKSAGFSIQGTIEAVEGKRMSVSTVLVTEEDDVAFYADATDKISEIMDEISGVIKCDKALPFNAQEALKAIGMKSESIEGHSEQELIDMVIDSLQERGAIIMMSDDMPDPKSLGESSTKLHQKSGSIDSHMINDAEEVMNLSDESEEAGEENDEKPVIIIDKAPMNFGTLASDKKIGDITGEKRDSHVDGSELADLEFSGNVITSETDIPAGGSGIESEDNKNSEW